jgi:hypothetical protein
MFLKAERGCLMENKLETWQVLCGQAAVEEDSERLMGLVSEISRLLDEKQEQSVKREGITRS